MLGMEHSKQFVLLHNQNRGRCNGCRRSHPNRLASHAALAKKITWTKHRDYRFFSGSIHNGKFHPALLDVHDTISSIPLRENRFVPSIFSNFSRNSRRIEKDLRVERADLAIFLVVTWFHTRMREPPLHGRSKPTCKIPRRFLLRLCKREQSAVFLIVCRRCAFQNRR